MNMKRHFIIIMLWAICLPYQHVYACDVSTRFSPNGGAQETIIKEIQQAKESIYVEAYTLTAQPIILALENAQKRGLKVKALTDKKQQNMPFAFPSRIDTKHSIMHDKVILLDDTTIISGSYNYTNAAEYKNAENLLIIKNCPDVAQAYRENWQKLWSEAK